MKQIILITDGNSNAGVSPVTAAARAYAQGVVVNVIGIVGEEEAGWRGEQEIEAIAKAGGGIYSIVLPSHLSQTMQMMTRRTVVATIQQVVNEELRAILKEDTADLSSVPPDKRSEIVRTVDRWTESVPLQVALLVDASASMKSKFQTVREAAADLMMSMQARAGKSELMVLHFPGKGSAVCELDAGWTIELAKVEKILYKLNVQGTTPTGPAIMHALALFEEAGPGAVGDASSSEWGDYVV